MGMRVMMMIMMMKMMSWPQVNVHSVINLSPVAWHQVPAHLATSDTTQNVVESMTVQVPGHPSTSSCDIVAFSCQDLEGFLKPLACYYCKGGHFIALLDL